MKEEDFGLKMLQSRTRSYDGASRLQKEKSRDMLVKNQNYQPPTPYLFLDEKRKLKLVERVKKQIAKFDLKQEDLGFAIT